MKSLPSKKRYEEILTGLDQAVAPFILGDVGVDKYTYGEVSRISPEAPVPIVEVKREWFKLGLAANVSDNLKSLGIDSTLCGIIGEDKNASLIESLLEEKQLKIWGLIRAEGRPTTLKERVTTRTQQICRVDYENKEPLDDNLKLKVCDRIEKVGEGLGSAIIQDYNKGLIDEEMVSVIKKKFQSQGKLVLADPSREAHPKTYQGVDLLKPNRVEAYLLTESLGHRTKNLDEMTKILIEELELKHLVVTLGAEGMALRSVGDSSASIIPTVANEVYDVSGAGDTVIATLTAALTTGASLEEAAWLGNCAAGVVVGKMGTATVTRKELLNFYDTLSNRL
jgi:D-glycero-beta-D-manno-heptose-7-phosphate kinase